MKLKPEKKKDRIIGPMNINKKVFKIIFVMGHHVSTLSQREQGFKRESRNIKGK